MFLGGLSDGPAPDATATLMSPVIGLPFFYYIFCFATSSARDAGWTLFIVGVIIHLALIPVCYHLIHDGAFIFVILPALLTPCWFRMCLQKIKNRNTESLVQVITELAPNFASRRG